jgi:hypothetical protein
MQQTEEREGIESGVQEARVRLPILVTVKGSSITVLEGSYD